MKTSYFVRSGCMWLSFAILMGWLACTPTTLPKEKIPQEQAGLEQTADIAQEQSREPVATEPDAAADATSKESPQEAPNDAIADEVVPEFPPLAKDDPASAARNRPRPYLTPSPREMGMKDLESMLEPIRKRFQLPSLIAAVYQSGKLTAMGAVGARKALAAPHIQLKDKFHLGSCTKAMTATVAAILVEQGKIKWDTDIATVFASWKDQIHPAIQGVTLRQLLANRSGITSNLPQAFPFLWRSLWTTKLTPMAARLDLAKIVLKAKPEVPPNTQFVYSNTGFIIAGAMLEQVMGKPWETLTRELLFQPLGMASCGFGTPEAATSTEINQPWGHVLQQKAHKPIEPGPAGDNPPALGPAGTVHCNLFDWSKFLALHLEGARGKTGLLLKPESFQELHKPLSSGTPYALGWVAFQREWAKGLALFHNGTNTTFFASVWIAPKANKFFFAATNQGGESGLKGTDTVYATMLQNGF